MTEAHRVLEITPRVGLFPDLSEAWQRRGLLWMLVRRNVMVRYKQTLLAGAWAIIQPLMLAGILTIVVGMLLGAPSAGLPYPLFVFAGSTIWNVFQRVISDTSVSFAGNSNLILKVYFPRILIPLSSACTALVDFVPVFGLLLVISFMYGRFSGFAILATPFFVLLVFLLAFSIGLWITAIDALYRDLRVLVPSVLQVLLFLSPVMYAPSAIPAKWQAVYALNPLVAILQGFRWSVISGVDPPAALSLFLSLSVGMLLLISGLCIFARLERAAVDRI